MKADTTLKLGQIAGALLLAAGVASCSALGDPRTMAQLFIGGAALYGGCAIARWLRRPG